MGPRLRGDDSGGWARAGDDGRTSMIPKSCRLFGQDHAAEQVVVVSSLGMEASEQEHRNKNKYRGDERKVHDFRYRVSESRTFDHDRLLEILSVMMSSTHQVGCRRIQQRP
jgi:hypothetical protein